MKSSAALTDLIWKDAVWYIDTTWLARDTDVVFID